MSGSDLPFSEMKDLACKHGRAFDVVDDTIREQGGTLKMLIDNHLLAAMAYSSDGSADKVCFSRLREQLDRLEQEISSAQ
jgi:hypothetical protein